MKLSGEQIVEILKGKADTYENKRTVARRMKEGCMKYDDKDGEKKYHDEELFWARKVGTILNLLDEINIAEGRANL